MSCLGCSSGEHVSAPPYAFPRFLTRAGFPRVAFVGVSICSVVTVKEQEL